MSYYSKARKDLAAAAAKNIITAEQEAALIRHFEERRGFFSRLTLSQWLGAAGGLFIAIGIILIIAFNWDQLGNFIKIAGYILMLGLAGYGFANTENRPAIHAVLGITWFFLPAAGIGLFAQIFQLSGTPVKPYVLWAALSLPLALWGGSRIYSRMLCILLFGILFYGTFESTSIFCLISDGQASRTAALRMLGHWTAALALLAAALGINFWKKDSFSPAIAAALAWIIILLCTKKTAMFTDSAELNLSAGIAAAVLLALYKMKFSDESSPAAALINNGTRIWAVVLYILSFMHGSSWKTGAYSTLCLQENILGIITALALISASLWLASKEKTFQENVNAGNMFKAMLAISIAVPFIPSITHSDNMLSVAIAANIILAAFGAWLLWAGSFYASKKTLHNGMFIISIIAITRFLDLFASQLTSGMAFILTGGIFAFMAWWFSRGADKIAGISQIQPDKNMAASEAEK